MHFFLSQKEKSSKKEVGERAARALSALAIKAREALRESPHIRAEPFAWRGGYCAAHGSFGSSHQTVILRFARGASVRPRIPPIHDFIPTKQSEKGFMFIFLRNLSLGL